MGSFIKHKKEKILSVLETDTGTVVIRGTEYALLERSIRCNNLVHERDVQKS